MDPRDALIAALPKLPKDQIRDGKEPGVTGRKIPLCIGEGNTCVKRARAGVQYCGSCLNILVPREKTPNQILEDKPDGTIIMHDGLRYAKKNGYVVILCSNETCTKRRERNGKCAACDSGVDARIKKADSVIGDLKIINGRRKIFNGNGWRKLCIGDGDTCKKMAQLGDFCSTHKPK